MNICFVTNGDIVQHATMKRAYAMAPVLVAKGHTVTLVVMDVAENHAAAAKMPGVRLVCYPSGMTALATRKYKEDRVAEGRYDVVHICGLGWRNALRPSRINSPLTIMDHVEIESTLSGSSGPRRFLQGWLESWSLRTYIAHIAASRYLEAWLRQRCFKAQLKRRLLWLPYANDYAGSPVQPITASAVRSQGVGKKILFYLGSFYRQYGFWEMLHAVRDLSIVRRDFVLVLAGGGPEQSAGEEFVLTHGLVDLVRFPGYLRAPEAVAHLQIAHACIVPLFDTETDWARCPGKLFICMNSLRPIVTAPVGEGREYFDTTEFYYDPNVSDSLMRVMERALATPSCWKPNYDTLRHTWEHRTEKWLEWLTAAECGTIGPTMNTGCPGRQIPISYGG